MTVPPEGPLHDDVRGQPASLTNQGAGRRRPRRLAVGATILLIAGVIAAVLLVLFL
jgi:hypothetical protein